MKASCSCCAPGHPGQPVEQEPAAAARGDPFQLGARTVNENGAQPAGLAVRAMGVAHRFPPPVPPRPRARMTLGGSITTSVADYASSVNDHWTCSLRRDGHPGARRVCPGRAAPPRRGPCCASAARLIRACRERPRLSRRAAAARPGPAVAGGGHDRPHGGAPLVRAHSPAGAQMLHDAQAAATDRGQRRTGGARTRRAAPVADDDLNRGSRRGSRKPGCRSQAAAGRAGSRCSAVRS